MEAGAVLEGRSGSTRSHSRKGSAPAVTRRPGLRPVGPSRLSSQARLTAEGAGWVAKGLCDLQAGGSRYKDTGPPRTCPSSLLSPASCPAHRTTLCIGPAPYCWIRPRPLPSRVRIPPRLLPGPRASAPPAGGGSFAAAGCLRIAPRRLFSISRPSCCTLCLYGGEGGGERAVWRPEGPEGRAEEQEPAEIAPAPRSPAGGHSDAGSEPTRGQPGPTMASTTTCTRFTDEYQLFEELGK